MTHEERHSFIEPSLPIAHITKTFTKIPFSALLLLKTLNFKDLKSQIQISSMEEPQSLVPNLNEMMEEYTAGEEEVHLEPQTKTTQVAELEVQKEAQNLAQKERKKKIVEKSIAEQVKEAEDNEGFISDEAYSLWKENMSDKGFIGERGFSTFISPFVVIIERGAGTCFASTSHLVMLQWSGSSTPI